MSILSSTGTLVAEIATRLNEVSTDNEDQYVTDINQCTRDVQTDFPFAPFLQTSTTRTLSAGTSEYALASDFEKMDKVKYPGGNITLTFLPQEQFDNFISNLNTSGSPTIYTIINGGTIKYAPVPGSSIDIEQKYRKLLTTVSTMSSAPPLPIKYYELYALYGEYRGLRRQGDRAGSQEVKNEYETLKAKMIRDLINQTTESVPIRSIRDFSGGSTDYGHPVKNIYGNL